tara:strand:- start:363 stop:1091 length:729 start_codon:yes stop_codon:yes gene_type:complete
MIIANWKMNGTKELIEEWIDSVSQNIHINKEKDCVFCPPTCYLDFAGSLIEQRFKDLKLGSQQVDSELSLPLTGGINSKMLVDLGCQFVIVGHSEQRMHLKENNQILSDKLKTATDNNLRPIFCIGESLQQKRANQTQNILKEQLSAIYEDILERCVIAYEPVWAIGTGDNAEISYIEEIHSFIKDELTINKQFKDNISVVYGGSVNLTNYKEIYSSDKVDGLLIGGASLDPNIFTQIYNTS